MGVEVLIATSGGDVIRAGVVETGGVGAGVFVPTGSRWTIGDREGTRVGGVGLGAGVVSG